MTDRERWVRDAVAFVLIVALIAPWVWLGVLNATKPAFTVESCVEVQVKRGAP